MEDAAIPRPAFWRRALAFILDFFAAFFGLGMLVAGVTGEITPDGFSLNGTSALVFFGLVIAYYVIGAKTGGTPFQRLLGAKG